MSIEAGGQHPNSIKILHVKRNPYFYVSRITFYAIRLRTFDLGFGTLFPFRSNDLIS